MIFVAFIVDATGEPSELDLNITRKAIDNIKSYLSIYNMFLKQAITLGAITSVERLKKEIADIEQRLEILKQQLKK